MKKRSTHCNTHGSAVRRQVGFTLIELMVTVAILAIVAAVGIPIYRSYVDTGREGALSNNIATLEIFQEDIRLRTGVYQGGTYDPPGDVSLTTNTGWAPQADDGTTYVVVPNGGVSYTVTGTDSSGMSRCVVFPARAPCP